MPQPSYISSLFVSAMNDRLQTGTKGVNYRGFDVIAGRAYDKVVNLQTAHNSTEERPYGVHAFIDRKTGDLIKAATWSAPQKNVDKTLAVRYTMTTPEEVQEVVEQADRHGSYLYKK